MPSGRTRRWSWSATAPSRSRAHVADIAPKAQTVLQAEQRGTGHAVRIALDAAPEVDRDVVVVYGDTPLLRGETLQALLETHRTSGLPRPPC